MPLFEFVCEKCAMQNEILVRGNEKPRCPACGSTRLTKQASAFAPAVARNAPEAAPCASAGSCSQAAGGGCPYQP